MDGYPFVHREHVRFRDLDAMGHINNAVFATYVEQARVEYLASLDVLDRPVYDRRREHDPRAAGDGLPRARRGRARRGGDRRPPRPGREQELHLEYRIEQGGDLVAEATTVLVAYDYERGRVAAGPGRLARRAAGARMSIYERHTLPNGLRVLTAPMRHAQSVTCFVMVAAGSRYETRETGGIAHFAEHMFFKGTERRPTARDIAGEIDAIGGEFNAFTSKEYTGYYVKCAAEHRDIALDVLVDMLRNSKFDAGRDRAREGRDHRGDEHVLRHAARLDRRRVRGAALRRPAARPRHHRPQGDGPGGDARDVPRLPRPLVPAVAHGRRRSAARSATACTERIGELLGDLEDLPGRRRRAARSRSRERPREAATRRSPTRRT